MSELKVKRTGTAIKVREVREGWSPVVAEFTRGEVGEAMFAAFVSAAPEAGFRVFDVDADKWLS